MSGTDVVSDLTPLAARYDGFLVDQFGVEFLTANQVTHHAPACQYAECV